MRIFVSQDVDDFHFVLRRTRRPPCAVLLWVVFLHPRQLRRRMTQQRLLLLLLQRQLRLLPGSLFTRHR